LLTVYRPCPSDTAVRTVPVDDAVTVTATPGRMPPLGSVTVPTIRDSVCCAEAVWLPTPKAMTASTNTTILLCTFTLPSDV
jgi:hypothetical protein